MSITSDGCLEITIKERITKIEGTKVAIKYMENYFNYGRNCTRITGSNDYFIFVDSDRELSVLKLDYQGIGESDIQKMKLLLFIRPKEANYKKLFEISKLQNSSFLVDTLCSSQERLYCLTVEGNIVKCDLEFPGEQIEVANIQNKQLHLRNFIFTAITAHLNMVVVGSFNPSCKTCHMTLLDVDLHLKHQVTFKSDHPIQAMHITTINHLPILTVLTASLALKSFYCHRGQLNELKCKFENLSALSDFYQESSPLSFSSPFIRASSLIRNDDFPSLNQR